MDKKQLDDINRGFKEFGLRLSLIDVEPVKKALKPKKGVSIENIHIIDPSYLPAGVWLNPKVIEAAKEVILEEYLRSGLVISGAEINLEWETENGEAKTIYEENISSPNRRTTRKTQVSGGKSKDNPSRSSKGGDRIPRDSLNSSKAKGGRKAPKSKGEKAK